MSVKFIAILVLILFVSWELISQLMKPANKITQYNLDNDLKYYQDKIKTLEQEYENMEISKEDFEIQKSDLEDKIKSLKIG